MIDQRIANNLTAAIAAWVSAAALELNVERMEVLGMCLKVGNADVRVEASLREGSIILAAINNAAGKRTELYRQDVEPVPLQTGFGEPRSRGGH